MEIAFHTRLLRDTCESEARLRQELGAEVGEMLKRRLADLRAAGSIRDVVLGNVKEVPGSRGEGMSIDLCDGYRIVVRANHTRNPQLANGEIDWSAVSRIKLMRIDRLDG